MRSRGSDDRSKERRRTAIEWTRARVAELCDECLDPIAPGDEMVRYDDESYVDRHGHIRALIAKAAASCFKIACDGGGE